MEENDILKLLFSQNKKRGKEKKDKEKSRKSEKKREKPKKKRKRGKEKSTKEEIVLKIEKKKLLLQFQKELKKTK